MLLQNKYWVIVLLFNLITNITAAVAAASGTYYAKWIFGNDNLVAVIGAAGMLATGNRICGFQADHFEAGCYKNNSAWVNGSCHSIPDPLLYSGKLYGLCSNQPCGELYPDSTDVSVRRINSNDGRL